MIIAAGAILIFSILFYHIQEVNRIKDEHYSTLKAVSNLKTGQIVQWMKERRSDAQFYSREPRVLWYFITPTVPDTEHSPSLQEIFSSAKVNHGYYNIYITDLNRKVLWTYEEDPEKFVESSLDHISTDHHEIVFSDFYFHPSTNSILIDLIAPIRLTGQQLAGYLVFNIDPKSYLFPFIQMWPVPSRTAETILLRSEGDSIVYLNELRHLTATTAFHKIPQGFEDTPSAQAVLGHTGIFAGKDYRSINVLSYIQAVPQSPWKLVVKIDQEEIYSDIRYRSMTVVAISAMTILLAVILLIVRHNTRQKAIYRELFYKEKELRESVEESASTINALIGSSMDAIMLTSPDGRIFSANAAACYMLGRTEEEICAEGREGLIDLSDTRIFPLMDERIRTGRARGEITMIRKDGTHFPVEISTSVFLNRYGEQRTSMVIRDITERKKIEASLEQRVADRTAELKAINKELESFAYSVSHDLRAPLRAIHGFTSILSVDHKEALDEEGRRLCGVILDNTGRMGRLIDDLLAFSRLSRSEMQVDDIDMVSLVRTVMNDLSTSEVAEKMELFIGDLPVGRGDHNLIRQVWINLLSNAIKFSARMDKIRISVTCSVENGYQWYCVKDNGAGFDMNYCNKLFGVFQRLHSPREFEGTGVGLAIVQRIIHRHGGEVRAEGKVGEGATFCFSLPA